MGESVVPSALRPLYAATWRLMNTRTETNGAGKENVLLRKTCPCCIMAATSCILSCDMQFPFGVRHSKDGAKLVEGTATTVVVQIFWACSLSHVGYIVVTSVSGWLQLALGRVPDLKKQPRRVLYGCRHCCASRSIILTVTGLL
eukprot:6214254-Pleurochrysis_carterae.AAC.1